MFLFLNLLASLITLTGYAILAAEHRRRPRSYRCYLALVAAAMIHLILTLLHGQ